MNNRRNEHQAKFMNESQKYYASPSPNSGKENESCNISLSNEKIVQCNKCEGELSRIATNL